MSAEIPRKIGEEDSRRLKKRGLPRGEGKVGNFFSFFKHLMHFFRWGEMIFLAWGIITPYLPVFILVKVPPLLRWRQKGPASRMWASLKSSLTRGVSLELIKGKNRVPSISRAAVLS